MYSSYKLPVLQNRQAKIPFLVLISLLLWSGLVFAKIFFFGGGSHWLYPSLCFCINGHVIGKLSDSRFPASFSQALALATATLSCTANASELSPGPSFSLPKLFSSTWQAALPNIGLSYHQHNTAHSFVKCLSAPATMGPDKLLLPCLEIKLKCQGLGFAGW